MKRYGFWLGAVIAAFAIWVAPLVFDEYWLRVISGILMWVAMAEALNIILGLGGYPAFGNGAFMGIGAYTSAILLTAGVPFWLSLVAAAAIAALTATVIGVPVLRLRGHYFAIATVGINFALLSLVENLNITGGGSGMSVPFFAGSAAELATFFFYAFAALALGSVILVYIIRRSPLGYALRAIQASEEAAVVMGINTTLYKVVAWSISAAVTGLAGGIYAYWTGYISPGYLFDIVNSVKLFIMVLLGGAGTVLGPVLGAIGIEAIGQFFWTTLGDLHLIALGLIILAVGLLMPKGFLHLVQRARQRGSARKAANEPKAVGEP